VPRGLRGEEAIGATSSCSGIRTARTELLAHRVSARRLGCQRLGVHSSVAPNRKILKRSAPVEPVLSAHGARWRWWHPFRRGLATNLHRLGVDDKTIQSLLRHSSVQTTREIYIKGFDGDAVAAMKRLETAIQSRPN
jgi:integrase